MNPVGNTGNSWILAQGLNQTGSTSSIQEQVNELATDRIKYKARKREDSDLDSGYESEGSYSSKEHDYKVKRANLKTDIPKNSGCTNLADLMRKRSDTPPLSSNLMTMESPIATITNTKCPDSTGSTFTQYSLGSVGDHFSGLGMGNSTQEHATIDTTRFFESSNQFHTIDDCKESNGDG